MDDNKSIKLSKLRRLTKKEFLSEFIAAYESLPELWDQTHIDYTKKIKRNKALEVLLNIYRKMYENGSIWDVKRKINILRSMYRCELRKVLASKKSGCTGEDIYKPTNFVFYAMQFIGGSEVLSFTNESEPSEDFENNYHNITNQGSTFDESDSDQPPSPIMEPEPDRKKHKKEKTKIKEAEIPMSNIEEIYLEKPISVIEKQNEVNRKFCNFEYQDTGEISSIPPEVVIWSRKIKSLQLTQRIYAEKIINSVLIEAQLGNLTPGRSCESPFIIKSEPK